MSEVQLYPYQEVTRDWLRTQKRTIVGDEFGVGKTFPTIAAMFEVPGPRLVVAPNYILYNWAVEIERWRPGTKVAFASGAVDPQKKRKIYNDAKNYDVVLTTYGLIGLGKSNPKSVSNKFKVPAYPEIFAQKWGCIVFDEVHHIRSHDAQTTRFSWKLKTDHLYMLTGTPIVKDAGDLFPLLKLIDPKKFTSYWNYVSTFCKLSQTPWATEIGDVLDAQRFAQEILQPYVLRRKLAEVNTSVPEAVYKTVTIPLTHKTQKAVTRARVDFIGELRNPDTGEIDEIPLTSAMKVTHVVRQLIGQDEEKISALTELLEEYPDEQGVIWCWYKDTVRNLVSLFEGKKRQVFCITGELSGAERTQILADYSKTKNGLLFATIGSLSHGVNLQSAALMFFFERDLLQTTNAQAVARCKRTGQTRAVKVFELIADKSIDLKIYRNCQRQAQMVGDLLSAVPLNGLYLDLARDFLTETT